MTEHQDSPMWLREALATPPAARPDGLREEAPAEVMPGDICIVVQFERSEVPGRLFLVTDVAHGWCEGMLAGTETELATEVDALIPARDSGLGYEIAVYSRFGGPIWITQVLRRIGAIESSVLDDVEKLAWVDEAEVSVPTGMPLQPEGIDPRFPALRALSTELDALTEHCRRRRHELPPAVLDPVLGDLDVLRVLLRERGWETQVATALSSADFVDRLLEAFPRLTGDERRVVMPLLERAIHSPPRSSPSDAPRARFTLHKDSTALASAVACGDEPGPFTRVVTHRRCWTGSVAGRVRMQRGSREAIVVFAAISETSLLQEVA